MVKAELDYTIFLSKYNKRNECPTYGMSYLCCTATSINTETEAAA